MNRRARRLLNDPTNQDAVMHNALAYFNHPSDFNNIMPLPMIYWGRGDFPWAKGYGAVPTKTLARETAIAGAVVTMTPERGSSGRCLASIPILHAAPDHTNRTFHRTRKATEFQRRCNHKYVHSLTLYRKKMIRGTNDLIHPVAPHGQVQGHHGRVRACFTRDGGFICRTSDCRLHRQDCHALCNRDHRRSRNVILHRQFECLDLNCPGNIDGQTVTGDRDYQAAGAMLGIGEHYERTLGGRYSWNLGAYFTPNNPYVPPDWPVALR
jgi:hypothetical protein